MTNRFLPPRCQHIDAGKAEAGERITLTTVGVRDRDYRYEKGPDEMEVCLFCAGVVLARLLDPAITGR